MGGFNALRSFWGDWRREKMFLIFLTRFEVRSLGQMWQSMIMGDSPLSAMLERRFLKVESTVC